VSIFDDVPMPEDFTKLPADGTFTLTCPVRVDAQDLQRFIEAGGTIVQAGFRLFIDDPTRIIRHAQGEQRRMAVSYAKELDRKELVLAVWAAEFARHMNGGAEAIVEGPILRLMTENAAKSADRLVEALRLLIEVKFSPITENERNDCYMTWEAFVATCESGGFIDDDGFGELATADHHVSNVRVHPSGALDQSYTRPDWATHVCWYNK